MIHNQTICEQPLIPLRGKYNSSHWLLHASYVTKYIDECNDIHTLLIDKCNCDNKWLNMDKYRYNKNI